MRVAIAALVLAATPAMAEPLWDMCYGSGSQGPEQCDCVTDGLGREMTAADHALYSAVATRYLQNLAEGKARAQAWEMAVQRESAAQKARFPEFSARVQRLSDLHAAIRTRCGGQ